MCTTCRLTTASLPCAEPGRRPRSRRVSIDSSASLEQTWNPRPGRTPRILRFPGASSVQLHRAPTPRLPPRRRISPEQLRVGRWLVGHVHHQRPCSATAPSSFHRVTSRCAWSALRLPTAGPSWPRGEGRAACLTPCACPWTRTATSFMVISIEEQRCIWAAPHQEVRGHEVAGQWQACLPAHLEPGDRLLAAQSQLMGGS